MNRLLCCLVLGTVAIAFGTPRSAWTFDRPVLALSTPRALPETNPEIRTSDSIVVAGRLKSVFPSHVTLNLYHVLPSGRVTGEHRVRSAGAEEGGFRFELFAPRTGWTKGTLRGIVHVDDAPQVRQTFELTVTGDPAAEQILESLPLAPKETGGTVVLSLPGEVRLSNPRVFGCNIVASGFVTPVPAPGTEVELLLYHAREDGRFVAEAGIATALSAEGKYQVDLSPPRNGWQNGRLIGVVRRKDAPEDLRHFETEIVGAPREAEPNLGIRLPDLSEIAIDLRAPALPAVQAGMRYLVTGESPAAPFPGHRQGFPVILEIGETRADQAKGQLQHSQFAQTLANEAGVLEFETEIEIRRDIPPGIYQFYLTPFSPDRLVSKVYNIEILPPPPLEESPRPPSKGEK